MTHAIKDSRISDTSTRRLYRYRDKYAFSRLIAPSFTFMQILQLSSLVVTLWSVILLSATWEWWLFAAIVYFFTGCVGLTVTLHRSLTHKSVIFPKPIEYLFTWFGAVGGTGSSVAWTAMHRAHHAHVDSSKDPHSPELLGWRILVSYYDYDFDPRHAKDLLRDPFHMFLHRFYVPLLIAWGAVLFYVDPKIGIFGFFLPVFIQITVSNLTTILTHSHGYKNFETNDESANNWIIAILAWGEGWHNNHHARPWKPIFQHRWWEIDAGGAFIAAMHSVGLAKLNHQDIR